MSCLEPEGEWQKTNKPTEANSIVTEENDEDKSDIYICVCVYVYCKYGESEHTEEYDEKSMLLILVYA